MRTIVDYENCGDVENLDFWDKIVVGVKKNGQIETGTEKRWKDKKQHKSLLKMKEKRN